MDHEQTKRPGLRRAVAAVLAIVLGVGVAFAWYHANVEPGATLLKTAFEAKPEVTPPRDFEVIARGLAAPVHVSVPAARSREAHLTIYRPAQPAPSPRPVVLWVHGGGFISSSAATVTDYAILLAAHGYVVANLDYDLAPAAQHPTPVLQANAAMRYLSENTAAMGGDPDRIFIGGDSAGAQIASETAAAVTNRAVAQDLGLSPGVTPSVLRGVILFCGLYDMETVGGTGFPGLRTYLWAYTGHRNWTDAPAIGAMSTTATATRNYPPTFISVGDADPFAPQARELAAKLRSLDVPVQALIWSNGHDLGHEYQFDFRQPEAREAFTRTTAFIDEETSR